MEDLKIMKVFLFAIVLALFVCFRQMSTARIFGISFSKDAEPSATCSPQSPSPVPARIQTRARRHVFVCRTFAGDRPRATIFPSMLAFLDLTRYHLVIILDDESEADHAWAIELSNTFSDYMPMTEKGGVHIGFSKIPSAAVLAEAPYREVAHMNARYSTPGFTRMVYDQFFFDTHLPPDFFEPFDNMYIVDADGPLFSVFIPTNDILSGGRITPPLFPSVSHWKGDSLLLQRSESSVLYDTMWTDAFPQAYRVSTFARTREHIANLWCSPDFEGAWLKAKLWRPLSPANVILNIGIELEPESYLARPPYQSRALPIFGSNRPRRRFARLGCCRAFGIPLLFCINGTSEDFEHLSFLNNLPPDPPLYTDARGVVAETYEIIHADLKSVLPWQLTAMRASCERVETWTAGLPE